jgi:NADH-quinone oxidoreductase subunit H
MQLWVLGAGVFVLVSLGLFAMGGLTLFFERRLIGLAQKRLGISLLGRQGWAHLPADVVKFWAKGGGRSLLPWMGAGAGLSGAVLGLLAWNLLLPIFLAAEGAGAGADFWDFQILAYLAYAALTTLLMHSLALRLRSKYTALAAGRLLLMGIFAEVSFTLGLLLLLACVGGYGFEELLSQASSWVISAPTLALFFFLFALFEAKRAPFDHPEAESELVAGHQVELGGRGLLLFYMCEYVHVYFCLFLIYALALGPGLDPQPLLVAQAFFAL